MLWTTKAMTQQASVVTGPQLNDGWLGDLDAIPHISAAC